VTLREARKIAGLSQQALAEKAGTTTTTIYDIEVGRNHRPSHETVVRIVRALNLHGLAGLTAEDLFPVTDHGAIAS
jgi:DNA-binding XRE family transcriptional regulator